MNRLVHMSRTLSVGIGVCFAALAVGTLAIAQNRDVSSARHFDQISNVGQLARGLSGRDVLRLQQIGARGELRHLATRGQVMFYVVRGVEGTCVADGIKGIGLASLACPGGQTPFNFPSDDHPIFDSSVMALDPSTNVDRVVTLMGLAADGVARVGIVQPNGATYTTDVRNNVYYAKPSLAVKAFVAYDVSGREIYRQEISGP